MWPGVSSSVTPGAFTDYSAFWNASLYVGPNQSSSTDSGTFDPFDVTYGDLIAAFVMAGVGMGLTFAPISTMALASVSEQERGVASGTSNTIRELGVAAGVAVLASVFSSYGGYTSLDAFIDGIVPAVYVGAAVVAAGALIALALPGKQRQ